MLLASNTILTFVLVAPSLTTGLWHIEYPLSTQFFRHLFNDSQFQLFLNDFVILFSNHCCHSFEQAVKAGTALDLIIIHRISPLNPRYANLISSILSLNVFQKFLFHVFLVKFLSILYPQNIQTIQLFIILTGSSSKIAMICFVFLTMNCPSKHSFVCNSLSGLPCNTSPSSNSGK